MATVKRREKKHVETGAAHIRSTFNNTIVTITDSTEIPFLGLPLVGLVLEALVRVLHLQLR